MSIASIIIPVFNQLHFTKSCIDSLLADPARPSYEIIVINNASTDGTYEYLEAKAKDLQSTHDQLRIIHNKQNLGVAAAWNQGLQTSQGEMIGILNNDIIVSPGWLRSLFWAMDFYDLGLVSPFVAVGQLNYDFPQRASAFTKRNWTKLWYDTDFCCVVLKRATFIQAGKFDERYLVGGYEDTDYNFRMKQLGIKFGISGAAFIHHFGSQTLGEFKRRGDKHVAHNKQHFIEKWGVDPSANVNTLFAKLSRTWRKMKLKWDYM